MGETLAIPAQDGGAVIEPQSSAATCTCCGCWMDRPDARCAGCWSHDSEPCDQRASEPEAAAFVPPGSDLARSQGCTCPVIDNNRGRFPVIPPTEAMPDGGRIVVQGCPLHDIHGLWDGWE